MIQSTSGTLGDSFIILLKLIDKDINEVNHYCYDSKLYSAIREILSLIDVKVNEVGKKELEGDISEGYLKPNETYNPFPKLNFPDISELNLPDEYTAICVQSGVDIKKHPWRFLGVDDLKRIPKDKPIVVLGTDNRTLDLISEFPIIDLRSKTNLSESFAVIAKANEFYGPQGLLGFVALSQKVKATLWLKNSMETHGMAMRIGKIKEWGDYITYVNLIK